MLPKPRAIIFDWDNTLVNTWPVIHEALNNTFRDMGTPLWTFDKTRQNVKKSMRDSFPEIFGDAWEKAAELYQGYYRSSHLAKLEALPRAAEVLARVKQLGIYNVVVSNKKGPNLRKEVAHIGWADYFDKVVGADDAARDKPHLDPVHLAFENSGITPGPDVWFIGDSEIDIECAENAGCTAILYGTHAKEQPQFNPTHYHGFPYHAHVDGHAQLLAILGGT
ncbi:MAG: HAD family hydrolase [Alphaproteobacteria bacterium]|nr:HAD family hydrolase [Alphaproteobacteria bacterium]